MLRALLQGVLEKTAIGKTISYKLPNIWSNNHDACNGMMDYFADHHMFFLGALYNSFLRSILRSPRAEIQQGFVPSPCFRNIKDRNVTYHSVCNG